MNAKKFSDAMSELDTKYVDEALNYKKKAKKPGWVKWGAMAACFALIAVLGVGVFQSGLFGNKTDIATLDNGNEIIFVKSETAGSSIDIDGTITTRQLTETEAASLFPNLTVTAHAVFRVDDTVSDSNKELIGFEGKIENAKVHVVDISGSEGRDPYEDYKKINVELRKYSKELAKRPQIVLLNKCDVYGAEENIKAFKKKLNYRREVFPVTAVTGEGLKEVVKRIVEILSELPAPKPLEFEEFSYEKDDPRKFTVTYDAEDNVYAIEGPIVKLLERNVVLDDMDSIAYMQKTLRRYGVIDALRKKGAKDGDTVLIGDIAFDYID